MTRLLVQKRNGELRQFELPVASGAGSSLEEGQGGRAEQDTPPSPSQPSNSPASPPSPEPLGVVEITSDEQNYNQQQQVVTAAGNVVMRFAKAILAADRLRVNLPNRLAVAEGNVVLKRGNQVLRGNRFEYYFSQDRGVIFNASGEIYQPTIGRDTSPRLTDDTIPDQPLSDRLSARQPLQRLTSAGGYTYSFGGGTDLFTVGRQSGLPVAKSGGSVNRLRFEAERLDFDDRGWHATNIRLTNDPFSPPELEVRADTANYRNIAPLVDELTTTNSRVVFDQNFALPIFQNRLVFDRNQRQPGLLNFAYDKQDRGGLYIQRAFNLIDTQSATFSVTPQYFIEKGISNGSIISPSDFGLKTNLDVKFGPRTQLQADARFLTLDVNDIAGNLRASVQLQQKVGTLDRPYNFNLQYNYRERLFNGSLGFQTVQDSFGLVVTSPVIPIGNTGINFNYQGGIQNIDASNQNNNIINLTRYQGAAFLNKGFLLWQGQPLPATPEEGLRYTPVPVLPFLQLTTGITGVASFYSNGDNQPSLSGSIGLQGQVGHFSRPYLDYTGFNITYSQGLRGGASPFLFDRFVDKQTLSFGITQQIYGPIRLGFQTSLSLDNSSDISTDYFFEYSRRTYSIILRYNSVLQIGSISFRISDFNWLGDPDPFAGTYIQPVIQGVTQ